MEFKAQVLGELVSAAQGVTQSKYLNESGTQYRVISPRNLSYLKVSGEINEVKLTLPNEDHYRLCHGDTVVSIRGIPLKASVITQEMSGSIAGQNLAILRPKKLLDSVYLSVILRSEWFAPTLTRLYTNSTGTQTITLLQLRQLTIPVPDISVQNKISQLFLATERATQLSQQLLEARQRLIEVALSELLGTSK